MPEAAAYLAIGAATGFFAGLLGIGGGTILVSSLALLYAAQGFPQAFVMHMAIGTSLAAIMAGAWASFRTHHRHGYVDWPTVKRMSPGLLAGVLLGAWFARQMSTAFLKVFFLAFMALIILQMLFGGMRPKASRPLPGPAGSTLVALLIGFSSSLFGGGAAAVGVPFLTWFGMTIHRAIGTAAAMGFPLAAAGAVGYAVAGLGADLPAWSLGFVYLPAVVGISIASVLVAPYGARLAHKLRGPTLRRIFAAFLLAIGAKLAVSV